MTMSEIEREAILTQGRLEAFELFTHLLVQAINDNLTVQDLAKQWMHLAIPR